MKKPLIALVAVVLVAVAGFFYWQGTRHRDPEPPPRVETPPQPLPPREEPAVRYPVPDIPVPVVEEPAPEPPAPPRPLPALAESDAEMREQLARFFPGQELGELFVLNNLIQRIVVTVDTLPQKELPVRLLPTRPMPGTFMVEGPESQKIISPQNQRRYNTFVRLVNAVDSRQAVAVYVRLYPLFQQAYRQLGHPGYFNDRLVAVIDHLLATPQVSEPIEVKQHVVRYRFVDPELEALSAGQKIMLRVGPDNARILKTKLREIRKLVTTLSS
ncbi:DUF3014 domain-containing protein [Geoalkalibacter halelectricus]|uniref:DUF3014 domain-containing protein n=1 Tax=Geoalkalibacter halelectricus TaxID=2847045 RepID=UPI003D1CEFEE